MKKEFEILRVTRQNIFRSIEHLSEEQLTKIPHGFKNNILWNAGHIVSAGQKLTYGLSGLPLRITEDISPMFGKGTSPQEWTGTPDIKKIREWLTATTDWLEEDYLKGIFKTYKEYPTSYGVVLRNIDDAIAFGNTHEAVHFGVIMALKKLV